MEETEREELLKVAQGRRKCMPPRGMESHWNCPFFGHGWNEGLKLPTVNNCPECSDQYREYRRSQTNHRSVHNKIRYPYDGMDRRIKNNVHDRLGKRVIDQNWADKEEHVWQEGQWCPNGLTRSQKRRVQRLRNIALEQKAPKSQVWHVKQIADKGKASAEVQMAFILTLEFMAPASQEAETYLDFDETEFEELVAKLALTQQAIFDKPTKHRHLKALCLKGLADGKPMTKMLVDGGAFVNLMPYITFRKLGKGPEDLLEIDMMLRDFGGNTSQTWGQSMLS